MSLFHLADGKVADDLGQLEDVAGLDLLAVELEAPVPVLRHLRDLVGEGRLYFLISSSSMMRRRPALPAFSHGTITVSSLWRILIVRYSRSSPISSRDSLVITSPAPWWDRRPCLLSRSRRRTRTSSSKTASMVASSSSEIGDSFRSSTARSPSALQVPVDQIDLLEPSQALAGCPWLWRSRLRRRRRDRLRRPQGPSSTRQLVGDLLDDKLWNSRDPAQRPVAARGRPG